MTSIEFNSRDLPATDQIDASMDFYSRIGDLHIEPIVREDFSCRARLVALSQSVVIGTTECQCEAIRSPSRAAGDNPYDVLAIALGPKISVTQKGRDDFEYGRGEAFLWRGDQAVSASYHAPSTEFLHIALPNEWLRETVADLDAVTSRRLYAAPEKRLLTTYVQGILQEAAALSPDSLAIVAEHIRDLTLMALGGKRDAAHHANGRGARAARLKAVTSDIKANLGNPTLSLDWLAVRHGISPRYLRALFYGEQTSFSSFVRNARLDKAHDLLADPRFVHYTITAIAAEVGFGDLSWFNQAFRRRFAMTPSDLRAMAREDDWRR